jgi:hypothetical protein
VLWARMGRRAKSSHKITSPTNKAIASHIHTHKNTQTSTHTHTNTHTHTHTQTSRHAHKHARLRATTRARLQVREHTHEHPPHTQELRSADSTLHHQTWTSTNLMDTRAKPHVTNGKHDIVLVTVNPCIGVQHA